MRSIDRKTDSDKEGVVNMNKWFRRLEDETRTNRIHFDTARVTYFQRVDHFRRSSGSEACNV